MSFPQIGLLRRALQKPPSVLIRRVTQEASAGVDRLRPSGSGGKFDVAELLWATGAATIEELWTRLRVRPFPFRVGPVSVACYDDACPGDRDRIMRLADLAVAHTVDLLGSGRIPLGGTIDWLTDQKTGRSWPPAFMRDIEYAELGRDSDVKFPWELSRLQWLIPAGQAFALTGDERYAAAARDVLEQWIANNPYAGTVNWSCTMEVALRIVSWTWLFYTFAGSESWADAGFQGRFLVALYQHGRFTATYLEYSDVNGNHCTADAAGLVFAGLLFGDTRQPAGWVKTGWDILLDEITKQVSADGVDYEGSVAYHRLVLELFLLTARYRASHGLVTPAYYRLRIASMARFVAAYSRPDGTTPLLGDADDGRMLPFGGQPLTDHRYLVALAALTCDKALRPLFSGPVSEVFWVCGEQELHRLHQGGTERARSAGFAAAGYFVMRNDTDHVFIDCAPVGLGGRGGHGHNDCLSFEAALDGVLLVADCGSYVYTASVEERNRFRSTQAHNTPQIAGLEINRFVAADDLWQLHYDALPDVREWSTSAARDRFVGSHSGYLRLDPPGVPVRTIELGHADHSLRIHDRFEGGGVYPVSVPLHLAAGVSVADTSSGELRLIVRHRAFRVSWNPGWQVEIESARVSPRYGVAIETKRLVWHGYTHAGAELDVLLAPERK